ncbi:efflux RND transporter permease subunit [Minwuia thermotolerans]|uniref:Multidrug transporter AcrB n=1 Tax=Minwuia thermotolerans TaxID=2056226 RepID=A0A2M9G6M5_9PROT|nr:efflux RND transporter permease subunit [Minwuia thermotolerans]PJK31375.1 multidrug transporter AcrB [Minwuia thermotolerans]
MTLSERAVRRPVLAVVAALLILVLGVTAALRLPVREYPDIDPPQVSVSIVYPGASAEVVERDVTQVVEDNLNGIDGVDLIDSTSRAGFAQITIAFELYRDLDAAAADVRDRVSAVRGELPDEAEEAIIRKASAQADAMMWLTLTSSERDRRALTDFAIRNLVDRLSILRGVSQVIVGGERRYAMRVWLDRERMAARGVTVSDVATALRRENLEAPAGRIEAESREFTVRVDTQLPDREAFRDLVLRANPDGTVRLGDVAAVELGAEDDRSAVFRSGEPAVGLGVVRQSGSNTLAVAERVRAELDALEPQIPADIDLAVSYDQSAFIEGSIREVVKTLLITIALVIAVVYLALGSLRGTLVPASTIPVSAIGAFAVMYAAGFTINTLTLLALVLAIGLVVDDAIVVLENVTRKREEGEPALAAGVRGASEVFMAVVATTTVLAAVLLPIAALTGFVGRLFTEFAITLTAAVVFSSFLALTLGAMLASRTVQAGSRGNGGNPVTRLFTGALARAEKGYAGLARRLLAAPWLVALIAVVLGASGYLLFTSLPGKLAPTEDRGAFLIPVSAPEGATLAETKDAVAKIAAILQPHMGADGPIADTISIVGTGNQGPAQVTEAFIIAKLKPWGERDISQQNLVAEVTGPILALPDAEAVPISPASLTPEGFGKPIQFVIQGPGYAEAYRWARMVAANARESGLVRNLEVEFSRRSPEIALAVDRRLAADLGLSAARIGEALRIFLGGDDITEFYRDGETYQVMVRGRDADRRNRGDIGALQVRNAEGEMVPLAAVIATETIGSATSYRRIDRRPSVVLSAVPAEGADLARILAELDRIAAERLPPEAGTAYLGLSRDFAESSAGVMAVFAMALVVVYLVLAALFSGFHYPLTVMLAVPLALTAALAALWAGGFSLNIFSQIGLLLAIGLLAKNAILVVDFANRRRKDGDDLETATLDAARTRFRPVVMTSIATLFGALPLALATGPGAESRSVIGITVMAGVAGATLITLLIVPGLYRLIAPWSGAPGATSRRVDRELAESGGDGPPEQAG